MFYCAPPVPQSTVDRFVSLVRCYRPRELQVRPWVISQFLVDPEALSRELFGRGLDSVLTAAPAELRSDWRTVRRRR